MQAELYFSSILPVMSTPTLEYASIITFITTVMDVMTFKCHNILNKCHNIQRSYVHCTCTYLHPQTRLLDRVQRTCRCRQYRAANRQGAGQKRRSRWAAGTTTPATLIVPGCTGARIMPLSRSFYTVFSHFCKVDEYFNLLS